MIAALSVLPLVLVVLTMGLGTYAAIGRAATPAHERVPLREWGWRELRSNIAIGRREWATAVRVAYGVQPSIPRAARDGSKAW